MTYPLIKGQPIPTGRIKYPFHEMEVGDAFDAPSTERAKVNSAAMSYGKYHGLKFSLRAQNADTVRCWRVA